MLVATRLLLALLISAVPQVQTAGPTLEFAVEIRPCSPMDIPNPLGAALAYDLTYAFRLNNGRPTSIRKTSADVKGFVDKGVPSCVGEWRFHGWPDGTAGTVRFRFTHMRGWQYLEVRLPGSSHRIYQDRKQS